MKKRLQKCASILSFFYSFFCSENAFATDNGAHGQYGSPPRTNRSPVGKDVSPDSVADDKIYIERGKERKEIPFPSFSFSAREASRLVETMSTIDNRRELAEFKIYLENTVVFNVDGILNRIQVLLSRGLNKIDIGSVLSESADQFSKHDFFSINRFAGSSSATSATVSELTDEDLMNNWRRWYAYKLLSSYYSQKSFDPKDETLADKFLAHSYLLTYRDNPKYVGIEATASEFYEKQSEIQKEIESRLLAKGIDCKDLVTYASDVY